LPSFPGLPGEPTKVTLTKRTPKGNDIDPLVPAVFDIEPALTNVLFNANPAIFPYPF
jgi:hypothetical protein